MTDTNYILWLDALRSGAFKQAQRVLFDGKGYCCLGVADKVCFGADFIPCTHAADAFPYVDDIGNGDELDRKRAKVLRLNTAATAQEVAEVDKHLRDNQHSPSGFNNGFGSLSPPTRMELLIALNDNDATFEQIADFIERNGWNKQ